MRRREFILTAAGLGAAVGLAACGKSGSSTTPGASAGASASGGEISGEVKVTYQQFGDSKVQANFLTVGEEEFEAAHHKGTVQLQPIVASENDYYTKLQLMMRSPRTSPDLFYEDTFLINSDIEAGYLRRWTTNQSWPDWRQFEDTAKAAAQAWTARPTASRTAPTPGPSGTTRRSSPRPACRPTGSRRPGTTCSPPPADQGEGARRDPDERLRRQGRRRGRPMQGFEMLLYGTGNPVRRQVKKWVVGTKAFTDALTAFQQVCTQRLGPTRSTRSRRPGQHRRPGAAAAGQARHRPRRLLAVEQLAPQRRLAVAGLAYSRERAHADPERPGHGKVTLSGGWTWAIPKNSKNANAAWEFIKMLTSKERSWSTTSRTSRFPFGPM